MFIVPQNKETLSEFRVTSVLTDTVVVPKLQKFSS